MFLVLYKCLNQRGCFKLKFGNFSLVKNFILFCLTKPKYCDIVVRLYSSTVQYCSHCNLAIIVTTFPIVLHYKFLFSTDLMVLVDLR